MKFHVKLACPPQSCCTYMDTLPLIHQTLKSGTHADDLLVPADLYISFHRYYQYNNNNNNNNNNNDNNDDNNNNNNNNNGNSS